MKYLMPFKDMQQWEHNIHCDMCKQIDEFIMHVLNEQIILPEIHANTQEIDIEREVLENLVEKDKLRVLEPSEIVEDTRYTNYPKYTIEEKHKIIIHNETMLKTLEAMLVDGYRVINVYKAHNRELNALMALKTIDSQVLARYNSLLSIYRGRTFSANHISKEKLMPLIKGTDASTTLYSRWCSHCGARKLDIYDTLISERMDLLPITNFSCKMDNGKLHITWCDSSSYAFEYSCLIFNDVIIGIYSYNEHEREPVEINISNNIPYTLYVVNFDRFNHEIVRTPVKLIFIEDEHRSKVKPITDIVARQEIVLEKDEVNNYWQQKKVIRPIFTATTDRTIIRRALNEIPAHVQFGLTCDEPYQVVPNEDEKLWVVKPFPVSQKYVKKNGNNIIFYEDINYDSTPAFCQLSSYGHPCRNLRVKNYSREAEVTWEDSYKNWKSTRLYLKVYDGKPIRSIMEGELIYEVFEENKYKYEPYLIKKLRNGYKYQLGIFPVTKQDLVMVDANQLILEPAYIKPSHYINDIFVSEHERNIHAQIGEIRDINKREYEIRNAIYIGDFYWYRDKFITDKNTILWFETQYPVIEGGKLQFQLYNEYPVQVNIYSNHLNIFNKSIEKTELHRWTEVEIEVAKMQYCKIVIEVESCYANIKCMIKDLVFHYNMGEDFHIVME